jgi:protease IV
MRRRWIPIALWALCVAPGCAAPSCQAPDEHLIHLPDDQTRQVVEVLLSEAPEDGDSSNLLGPPTPDVSLVIRKLHEVIDREVIGGVFLRLGPMGGAWGRAADLIGALQAVRTAGKPVHCHAENVDNVAVLVLVSACDRLSMTPAGMMDLVGPAAHVFYARSLLDRIGVQAELVQVGRYKGAADPLTRDDMPEAIDEALGAILDGLHANLVNALAEHRDMSADEARKLIDGGPYGTHDAMERGLIDHVAFDDEAREHARRAAEADRVERVSLHPRREPMGLRDLFRALGGDSPSRVPEGPRVGLVMLAGTIVDAERDGMGGVRSGPVVRVLRRMADDDAVKAVVLRIHSPGGSALASDRIWHAVRRVAKRKPVIASIGDMAASGGYYVASAATEILAHDASLVGSIGVVGGKIRMDDLADRLGVNVVVKKRGAHAAWTSPFQPMTDGERRVLEHHLQSTYARFIKRVAQGRDMEQDDVRAAAEGRLMLGAQAKELGLVDETGGVFEALHHARTRGDLPADAPVERWPGPKTVLDAIAQAMGGGNDASLRSLLDHAGAVAGPLGEAATLPLILGDERVAVALPFVVRIR